MWEKKKRLVGHVCLPDFSNKICLLWGSLSWMFSHNYFPSFYFLAVFGIIYKSQAARLEQFCRSQLKCIFLLLIVPERIWKHEPQHKKKPKQPNKKPKKKTKQNKRMNTKTLRPLKASSYLEEVENFFITWSYCVSLKVLCFKPSQ